ncbi:MAG: lipoyl(octanoyl) transferase LipB [Balneolia bacterium]|nr:lipoyl(octanoyl) transferase LipB [Balneolia bacterium]
MPSQLTKKRVQFADLGLSGYESAWQFQQELQKQIISRKSAGHSGDGFLLFTEHPHVYTLGKNGSERHLLLNADGLKRNKATFVQTDRGGDITYHGPGQLVGYPILDLDEFGTDIGNYLNKLEEVIIRVLSDYGIDSGRSEGFPGVWVDGAKICAMGVKCSRWVTMHGFALNVNTNLNYFDHIVPCGLTNRNVTSIEKLLGKAVEPLEVKGKVRDHFASVFGCELHIMPEIPKIKVTQNL